MEQRTIYITLKVDYSYDKNKTTEIDAKETAISLAINPNYHTIENGTKLDEVKRDDIFKNY